MKLYRAVVEDNKDPKKLGRCRVRVMNIFDEIPTEDLPWASAWKDLNGNSILESVIALSIISVCLYIDVLVYSSVFSPKTAPK